METARTWAPMVRDTSHYKLYCMFRLATFCVSGCKHLNMFFVYDLFLQGPPSVSDQTKSLLTSDDWVFAGVDQDKKSCNQKIATIKNTF